MESAGAGKSTAAAGEKSGSLAFRLCNGSVGALHLQSTRQQECRSGCAQESKAGKGLQAPSTVSAHLKPGKAQNNTLPRLLQLYDASAVSRAQLFPLDPPPQFVHATVLSGAPDRQHLWVAGVSQVLQVQAGL